MRIRRLHLAKETLTELTVQDLDAVAGGGRSGLSCAYCLTAPHCLPTLDGCFTGTTTTN
jgi:hypothetical protein